MENQRKNLNYSTKRTDHQYSQIIKKTDSGKFPDCYNLAGKYKAQNPTSFDGRKQEPLNGGPFHRQWSIKTGQQKVQISSQLPPPL